MSQPPRKLRRKPETVPKLDLKQATEKFKKYREAGLHEEIRGALKKHNISPSALNGWLNDPEKALTATKAPYFVKAARELPPLSERKKFEAYGLLLKELGIPSSHAEQLYPIHGIYKVRHSLNDAHFKLEDTLVIDSRGTPGAVSFGIRYEARGRYHICDGLVIKRNNSIHLIGLSEKNMFIANFTSAHDPEKEIMYGNCSMEEIYAPTIGYGRMVLIPKQHKSDEKEESFIKEYLLRPVSSG